MTTEQIDAYLVEVPEPARSTLESLRRTLHELLPGAEETISYGIPAFKVNGKAVAGFAGHKKHCSYYPFSGSVLATLGEEIAGYSRTKSALHFPVDTPLDRELVERMLAATQAELALRARK